MSSDRRSRGSKKGPPIAPTSSGASGEASATLRQTFSSAARAPSLPSGGIARYHGGTVDRAGAGAADADQIDVFFEQAFDDTPTIGAVRTPALQGQRDTRAPRR